MLSIFRRLAKDVRGASAIEYTLIASLIAVAAIASMRSVGSKVNNVLANAAGTLNRDTFLTRIDGILLLDGRLASRGNTSLGFHLRTLHGSP